jgi:aquaporin Z
MQKIAAEFIGTFWLVLAGCGSAVLAAAYPELGIGFLGVALAFGLGLMTAIFAVGHVSGGHFNPAVSVGLCVARRISGAELPGYIIAQLAGASAGAGVLYLIASGKPGFDVSAGFATNGFGVHSPGGYSMTAGLIAEAVLTFIFLFIILGATERHVSHNIAPVAIGLGLSAIHLVGIPVTNLSVNPARSTGPALVQGGWALEQLWLFWVAPIAGAVIAGAVYPLLSWSRTHAHGAWHAPAHP